MPNSTCKSCGASITWAISAETGAKIPLVPMPADYESATHRYRLIDASTCDPDPSGDYMSHFRNCPGANNHSKGGKRG